MQNLLEDPSFVILDQTDKLIIGHLHENAYLYQVEAKHPILLHYFMGNPTSGIISQDNTWAMVAGEDGFFLWTPEHPRFHSLSYVHDLRQINTTQCYILTDPWSPESAIYLYDIPTMILKKITPFTTYIEQPYTDDVIW